MFFIIKGKPNLTNYFAYMVLFTVLLVIVVIGSFVYPTDKTNTALLMALLTSVSVGLNMKVISLLLSDRRAPK